MLLDAFDSNWIAPLGPDVDAFERELAERVGVDHAVALSSGTAALHLALLLLGVGPGDDVLVPSFTFVATAAPVMLPRAPARSSSTARRTPGTSTPTWWPTSWPTRARAERAPRGVGHRRPLRPVRRLRAAGGLCAPLRGPAGRGRGRGPGRHLPRPAGRVLRRRRRLLVQRQQDHHHQRRRHAGHRLGRAGRPGPPPRHPGPGARSPTTSTTARLQLPPEQPAGRPGPRPAARARRPDRTPTRRSTRAYRAALGDLPGIAFMPVAAYGEPNYWLTCILVDPGRFGADRERPAPRPRGRRHRVAAHCGSRCTSSPSSPARRSSAARCAPASSNAACACPADRASQETTWPGSSGSSGAPGGPKADRHPLAPARPPASAPGRLPGRLSPAGSAGPLSGAGAGAARCSARSVGSGGPRPD